MEKKRLPKYVMFREKEDVADGTNFTGGKKCCTHRVMYDVVTKFRIKRERWAATASEKVAGWPTSVDRCRKKSKKWSRNYTEAGTRRQHVKSRSEG